MLKCVIAVIVCQCRPPFLGFLVCFCDENLCPKTNGGARLIKKINYFKFI